MKNLRHFKFQIKNRRVELTAWQMYFQHKRKEKHDEYDKSFLKDFRAQIKNSEIKVIVTHIPTKIKEEFIVPSLNRQDLIEKLRKTIQEQRASLRHLKTSRKDFDGASYEVVAGVFTKPEKINSLAQYLTTNNPLANKKPRTNKRNYIGIELEFLRKEEETTRTIGEKFRLAGLSKYVCVTTDPSCGFEVRVLLEEDGFEVPLAQILEVLNKAGFQVDDNCGTHVHLDMRNRNVGRAYKNLVYTQPLLRKFMTKKRKTNKYCKINRIADFDTQNKTQGGDRYYGINTLSYETHRTIEIRMHQGTLDFNTLRPYIQLLTNIVNYQNDLSKDIQTIRQAKIQYKLDKDLTANLASRLGSLVGKVIKMTKETASV